MSDKRKDSKGRLLRTGETQKNDGRYEFRFTDTDGSRKSVYSWRLVETDRTPAGKKQTEALRTMEEAIRRDLSDGISRGAGSKRTLNELWDEYMARKVGLRETTANDYKARYDCHIRNGLGTRKISGIKPSDISRLYDELYARGLRVTSVESVNRLISPVFRNAVRDGLIRVSPTEGLMADFKRGKDAKHRKNHALDETQQQRLLRFVHDNPKCRRYSNLITVLLGTGIRVGECAGLQWSDVDFSKNIISINHNLQYRNANGTMKYYMNGPKTTTGKREIPMTRSVREALLDMRSKGKNDLAIGGYKDFVFTNPRGGGLSSGGLECILNAIKRRFNEEESIRSKVEGYTASPIARLTPHTLRHTFCTRLCEKETNIKVIQSIMGHADAKVTMEIYNEATLKKKAESMRKLEPDP